MSGPSSFFSFFSSSSPPETSSMSSSSSSSHGGLSAAQTQKLEKFKNFTEVIEERVALNYLRKYNWNIEQAVDGYYIDGGGDGSGVGTVTRPGNSTSWTGKGGGGYPPSRRTNSTNRNNQNSLRSCTNNKKLQSNSELDNFFNKYKTKEEKKNIIDSDGLADIMKDVDVEYTDPVLLVIAYLCKCKVQGIFTEEEFKEGMLSINCYSVEKLKDNLGRLRQTYLDNPAECRKIYTYTYAFALDEGCKSMHVDIAIEYWRILLKPHFNFFDEWLEFIEEKKEKIIKANKAKATYKHEPPLNNANREVAFYITKDTWICLFDFAVAHKNKESFSSFDFEGAWPTLIDEFVTWFVKKKQEISTK